MGAFSMGNNYYSYLDFCLQVDLNSLYEINKRSTKFQQVSILNALPEVFNNLKLY